MKKNKNQYNPPIKVKLLCRSMPQCNYTAIHDKWDMGPHVWYPLMILSWFVSSFRWMFSGTLTLEETENVFNYVASSYLKGPLYTLIGRPPPISPQKSGGRRNLPTTDWTQKVTFDPSTVLSHVMFASPFTTINGSGLCGPCREEKPSFLIK